MRHHLRSHSDLVSVMRRALIASLTLSAFAGCFPPLHVAPRDPAASYVNDQRPISSCDLFAADTRLAPVR